MSMTAVVDDSSRLLRDIRRLVQLHRDLGIEAYPRSPELGHFLEAPAAPAPRSAAEPTLAAAAPKVQTAGSSGRGLVRSGQTLADLQAEFGDCGRCPLHETREGVVFGAGNPQAALFIVGDAPTPDSGEVAVGAPFSGEAGALLAKMLKAIGLSFDDVYLSTLVKCRSAGSESLAAQIKTCLPFLLRQIDAVAPLVICAMGPLATQTLLGDNAPLIRLRGSFHDYHGRPLMPTFHPAFLLKNPEMKKAAWIDLQLIQAKLGRGKGVL